MIIIVHFLDILCSRDQMDTVDVDTINRMQELMLPFTLSIALNVYVEMVKEEALVV